jgi:DNA mismatch repair protein PMS2
MAARHTTSKISSFDDVYTGTGMTMGFRGEALFSMACSSQQLVVATRTEEEPLATKLMFDRMGRLMNPHSLEQFPRKVGTTAAVVNPFMAIPARRADMARNIRRHRTKIFKLMEAYSIFNVGTCFQLIDIVPVKSSNGPRSRGSHGSNNSSGQSREDIALNTSASSQRLEETVSSVLGPKFLHSVTQINIELDALLEPEYGENLYNWGIRGLITSALPAAATTSEASTGPGSSQNTTRLPSKASRGVGHSNLRSVHYYSINGRVVDFPHVTTLVKNLWEAYGKQSRTKTPSVILDFTLPNRSFDINIAPDKQTIVLVDEQAMLALIKEKVVELWSQEAGGVFRPTDVVGVVREGDNGNSNSKLSADSSGDEECDIDEEPQRHKRRFAFVNDLSQAKMQHDLAERRRSTGPRTCDDDENVLPVKDQKPTSLSVDDANDDRPSKKVRTSVRNHQNSNPEFDSCPANCGDDGQGDHDAADGEAATIQPNDNQRISDLARMHWTEVQAKFQQSRLDRNPDPVTPEDQDPAPTSIKRPDPLLPKESPTSDSPISSSSILGDRKDESSTNKSSKGPSTLLNLRQFAFQPQGSTTDVLPRRISSGSSFKSRDRSDSGLQTEMSHPSHDDVMHLSSPSRTSEPPIQIRENESDVKIMPNIPPETLNQTTNTSPPSMIRSEDEKSARTVEKETSDEFSSVRERADAAAMRRVVWESFSGTEAVCQSALRERLQNRQQKQNIAALRRKSATTPDGNEGEAGGDVSFKKSNNTRVSPSIFGKMEVIGQFNLGFIVAKDPENNLWILDQHACDERIQYEDLLRDMKVQEQPLIRPLPIELSPAEEACVLDYMDVFRANGFRFAFDSDAPIRHRLSLTALPHSGAQQGRNAVQFGPSDVRSLCEMLMEGSMYDAGSGGTGTDGSGKYGNNAVRRLAGSTLRNLDGEDGASRILARLPKAVAMCASRACRSSIMIGTALSSREMEAVVRKLATVVDPFHCAHGRPNQHSLGSLVPILYQDEKRAATHYADPTITITPLTQESEEPLEEK